MKPNKKTVIWCCSCNQNINARLTDGSEIYPHREDLYNLPFWVCDVCGNYVGCHHKTKNRTRPLGSIPSPDIRTARNNIHFLMDTLWKDGLIKRNVLYERISNEMGYTFHTANIKTLEESNRVIDKILRIRSELVRNRNP